MYYYWESEALTLLPDQFSSKKPGQRVSYASSNGPALVK